MKFLKRKGYENTTIRKVVDDDRTELYGVVGKVSDLLDVGILEWCEYDHSLWAFLSATGSDLKDCFGLTREEVTAQIAE